MKIYRTAARTARTTIIITAALLLTACGGGRYSRMLADVESCIQERPDSALAVLENIDRGHLRTEELRARHAVLLAQARDKNYIDETDDSLIYPAVKFYESGNNVRYQFLSLYYYGRILTNKEDYAQAMIAYTKAEKLVDKLKDNYLAGLLYVQEGDILRSYCDYENSLESYKKACHCYSLAGMEPHAAYALLDIGIGYWNIEDRHTAEVYINKALEKSMQLGDKYLEKGCYENLILLYSELDDTPKSKETIDFFCREFGNSQAGPLTLNAIANYYAKTDMQDSVSLYLNKSWDNVRTATDSIALYFQTANTLKIAGKATDAFRNLEKGIILQSRYLRTVMKYPIALAQKDYFKEQAEFNGYKLKKDRQIAGFILIIVILSVAVVLIYMRQRMMQKDLEISKYIDLADYLKSSISDKNVQLSEMSSRLDSLFSGQYKLLDRLSNIYYENSAASKDKDAIYELVRSEINRFSKDDRILEQVESIINTYKHNVISLIKEEIPQLSKRDLRLLCYIYAGFSTKAISVFIGETTGNVLTRKYRFRNRIKKMNTPNSVIILEEMP